MMTNHENNLGTLNTTNSNIYLIYECKSECFRVKILPFYFPQHFKLMRLVFFNDFLQVLNKSGHKK